MKSKINYLLNIVKSKYVLSLTSNGVNAIVGMATLSILFRSLTQEDMGNWVFFLTVLLLVDTFRSGFLTTAFVKFYAGADPARQNEIVGSAWFIAGSITLIFVLLNIPAYFLSLYVKDESVSLFLRFFSVNYVFSLPFFVANCILQGKQRYDRLLVLNFTNQGSFLVLLLIVIALGKINIHTVVYCYLASNFISSSMALVRGWSNITLFKYRNKQATLDLFNFGKFSVGTNLSATLLSSVDAFIIKLFLGPGILAVYNAGVKLIQVVEIPLRSFVYTAMPTLSSHYNAGEKNKVLSVMQSYVGMLTIAMIPFCIVGFIFADWAVLILGGSKYVTSEAPNILRIFLIMSLLYPAERFFALTLDVIHLPKINFLKVMLMLAVTISTDLAAVYFGGGIYAISMASVFVTLTGMVIGYYALNKHYQKFGILKMYQTGYLQVLYLIKENYQRIMK